MNNDYGFWEDYLKKLKKEIRKLCKTKDILLIDLHIHSNYSADGKQSLNQIIESTKKQGFDIIAITDHDSVNVYDELYNILQKGMTVPLIIPGIEFTTDNKEYGNQCHMLQLFINPKDKEILKDVETSYNAMFNRSKIQFQRLKENISIQSILKQEKIKISYKEYLKYLEDNSLIPEYDTLMFYLIDKFKQRNVTTFKLLEILEKDNEKDCYEDRKEYKRKRFKKLREKYLENDKNNYNSRFLLSMLAVREVDDDWWPKPSSGSLSVNSYGQLKPNEINKKFKIFFAHPSEKSLDAVKKILKENKNIIGLENNIRNKYENIGKFYDLLKENNLLLIKGSDSHDDSLAFYDNMDFYKIGSEEILKIIKRI